MSPARSWTWTPGWVWHGKPGAWRTNTGRKAASRKKREMRATDARTRELLDRVDTLPREVLEKLHGAVRGLENGHPVPRLRAGARVRLRPGARRTDAQDESLISLKRN